MSIEHSVILFIYFIASVAYFLLTIFFYELSGDRIYARFALLTPIWPVAVLLFILIGIAWHSVKELWKMAELPPYKGHPS